MVTMKILLTLAFWPGVALANFANGECIKHKFSGDITYAVTGLNNEGSRYGLTVIQADKDGKMSPRSMLMGFPIHSSTIFVNQMFERINCHWSQKASVIEIYDDWYDPYLNPKEDIFVATKLIQMK